MGKRIHSIDAVRPIAIFFVIIIHTHPFAEEFGLVGNTANLILDSMARFAVPFFFITSGFFLASKRDNLMPYLRRYIPKIARLYVFGCILYLLVWVPGVVANAILDQADPVTALITESQRFLAPLDVLYYGDGIAFPLWFLTALIFSVLIVSAFKMAAVPKLALPIGAVFHLVGILDRSYPMVLDLPIRTRDALFIGFFYVALGYWIHGSEWRPQRQRWPYYATAVVAAFALALGERYVLGYIVGGMSLSQTVYWRGYTLATPLFALAVFTLVLSRPSWGEETRLPQLGAYAVGVYIFHLPVYMLMEYSVFLVGQVIGTDVSATLPWHILATPIVFLCSLVGYHIYLSMDFRNANR